MSCWKAYCLRYWDLLSANDKQGRRWKKWRNSETQHLFRSITIDHTSTSLPLARSLSLSSALLPYKAKTQRQWDMLNKRRCRIPLRSRYFRTPSLFPYSRLMIFFYGRLLKSKSVLIRVVLAMLHTSDAIVITCVYIFTWKQQSLQHSSSSHYVTGSLELNTRTDQSQTLRQFSYTCFESSHQVFKCAQEWEGSGEQQPMK